MVRWLDSQINADSIGGTVTVSPRVFLSGPSGSGKSLLLNILVWKWKKLHPGQPYKFFTGPDFCREVAAAIRGQLTRWRMDLGCAQLFALDDLSRIAGHEQAQRELSLLLDEYEALSIPVLLTSSADPSRIPGLSPQLTSRLAASLSIPIQPPELETRTKLLHRVFHSLEWVVPNEVVHWLAEVVHGTPSQIAHAISEHAHELKRMQPVTLKGVKSLWNRAKSKQETPLTQQKVIACVARYFRCTSGQLTGSSRKQHLVRARTAAIFLLRNLTNCSYREIGKSFGGRDHSTIRSAFENSREWMLDDSNYRQDIETLTTKLQAV